MVGFFPFLARVTTITAYLDEEHHYCFGNPLGIAEVLNTHTKHEQHLQVFSKPPSLLLLLNTALLPGPPRPGFFYGNTLNRRRVATLIDPHNVVRSIGGVRYRTGLSFNTCEAKGISL